MPDYGQPIENDLNFSSLLDFFRDKGKKDKEPDVKVPMGPKGPKTMRGLPKGDDTQEFVDKAKDDPKTDDTQTVTRTKKGGFIVIPTQKPAPKTVTHGPGDFDFPKAVEASLLKLIKAPVAGDDEAKWNDPRNTPENFPKKPLPGEFGNFKENKFQFPPDIANPSSQNIAMHGGTTTPDLRGKAWREKDARREQRAEEASQTDPSPSGRERGRELSDMLRERREQEADVKGMPAYEDFEVTHDQYLPDALINPDMSGPASFPPSKYRRGGVSGRPNIDQGATDWRANWENSVENSLLKLMKDEDEQELNPMEDPPKENKESQALVADGDSKRPKSEVGTNDKMFKKAEGPEPSGSSMGSDKAKRWAKIQRNVQAKRANQSRQDTLPGFEPEPPEEEPDTPDQLEHNVLKVMEHPEDRPQRSTDRLSIKRLQQLREGETDGPAGSKRVAPELSSTSFNAKPHTVPEDLPVKVRNSVKESLEKLMGESRQKEVFNFPSDTPETPIDAPIHPDPTEPETHPEQLQREAEATLNRHTRGGRESGAMGRRLPNDVSDQKFSGGAPERRKTPIGKTDDMEKGGSFYGGTRKQNIPQTPPQQEQPWGRKENEASKDAGIDKRIERLLTSKRTTGKLPKLGNLGDTRGQRKKSVENSLFKIMKEGEITPDRVGMTKKNALKTLDKAQGGNIGPAMKPSFNQMNTQAAFGDSAAQEASGMDTGVDHGKMAGFQSYNAALGATDAASKAPGAAMDAVTGAAKLGAKGAGAVARGIGNLFGGGKKQPTETPPPSDTSQTNTQQNYYSRDIK